MTEKITFYLLKNDAPGERRFLIPWGAGLGLLALLGSLMHRFDPLGLWGEIGFSFGLLSALVLVGSVLIRRIPVVWLTADGIFKIKPRGGGRGNFRWREPVEVEADLRSKSQGVLLWGEESADVDSRRRSVFGSTMYNRVPFRIPGYVLTDPAFRAALLRWAPSSHPLFAHLPTAGRDALPGQGR